MKKSNRKEFIKFLSIQDKDLHDELSKKIDGEYIRYFGIKFSNDDTGAYNFFI